MPRFFHLDNFEPEEEIVQSEWGQGRMILGDEWNNNAIAAIAAYLVDSAPKQALPSRSTTAKIATTAPRTSTIRTGTGRA